MIPDVGWRREGEGENVTGGELEIVAITYSQLPIPNYLFPITYSQLSIPNYLLPIVCVCDRATKDSRQSRQSEQQWREYWRVPQICLKAE